MSDLIGYLRVSTNGQAVNGLGLEIQQAGITAWAETNGHRIVAWRTDVASGSAPLDQRPGLYGATADVKAKKATGIVAYRLDRLARDLGIQELLYAHMLGLKATLHSTVAEEEHTLHNPTADPTRNMVRQIMGAVAEYERAIIRGRLYSGRMAAKAKGRYIGGAVPYGSTCVGGPRGVLVDDPGEQEQLEIMRTDRRAGASFQDIADHLNHLGLKQRNGRPWTGVNVGNVIRRRVLRLQKASQLTLDTNQNAA